MVQKKGRFYPKLLGKGPDYGVRLVDKTGRRVIRFGWYRKAAQGKRERVGEMTPLPKHWKEAICRVRIPAVPSPSPFSRCRRLLTPSAGPGGRSTAGSKRVPCEGKKSRITGSLKPLSSVSWCTPNQLNERTHTEGCHMLPPMSHGPRPRCDRLCLALRNQQGPRGAPAGLAKPGVGPGHRPATTSTPWEATSI